MVRISPPRNWRRAARRAVPCLGLLAGCSVVPQSRLDDCRRVTQSLRADNGRLKDLALDLRSQNQDLSQRAVDDSQRLTTQQEAIDHLEQSVVAYQGERDRLAQAFEDVKRQARSGGASPSSASLTPGLDPDPGPGPAPPARERLRAFAGSHPGWEFDPATATLSAAPGRVFEPGVDRLTPEAAADLGALAGDLAAGGPAADPPALLEVTGAGDPAPVLRAHYDGEPAPGLAAASGRFLAAARAGRVRDRLVDAPGLDPGRVRLAPPGPAQAGPAAGRLAIRLRTPGPADLDSPPTAAQ